jgi:hypothetical protein
LENATQDPKTAVIFITCRQDTGTQGRGTLSYCKPSLNRALPQVPSIHIPHMSLVTTAPVSVAKHEDFQMPGRPMSMWYLLQQRRNAQARA